MYCRTFKRRLVKNPKSHFLKENEYKINKKQSYLCVLSHSVLDSADIYSAVVLYLRKIVPKNLVFNWIFWKLTSHSNYIFYFVVIISMFIIISSLKPGYILPPVSKYENENQSYDLGMYLNSSFDVSRANWDAIKFTQCLLYILISREPFVKPSPPRLIPQFTTKNVIQFCCFHFLFFWSGSVISRILAYSNY